jgi:hypothetical protein
MNILNIDNKSRQFYSLILMYVTYTRVTFNYLHHTLTNCTYMYVSKYYYYIMYIHMQNNIMHLLMFMSGKRVSNVTYNYSNLQK